MSTSPRARARPSIDSETAGSTIPGNSVTMSMRIRGSFCVRAAIWPPPPPFARSGPAPPCRSSMSLELEQSLRRPDHHAARLDVDVDHDLRHHRDQVLALGAAHDPEVVGG